MRPTDQLLTRYASEIEEKQNFVDGVVEDAEKNQRDLTAQELELITRSRERIGSLTDQMKPLEEARRIGDDSHNRIAELAKTMQSTPAANDMEYRSAGHYLLDYWQARIGDEDAMKRLQTYQRTAAHQTTTDSTGVLPAPVIGPVLNFIDAARPLVYALGPRQPALADLVAAEGDAAHGRRRAVGGEGRARRRRR